MTLFHIVTPCRDAESRIGETMRSVLGQTALASGRAELRYRIVDGASTDGTVRVAAGLASPSVEIVSERDGGMYEALAKGLRGAAAGITAYLNAGDLYAPQAFDTVLDVFESLEVRWLTGLEVACNEKSQVIHAHLPYRYRARLFRCGAYGRILPFVQQESTFWDAGLNARLDLDRLGTFRFAGDYFLWHTFARSAPLRIVEAHLGTFRVHPGQMSERHMDDYLSELRGLCGRPGVVDLALALGDALVWQGPPRLKKALNREGLFRYDSRRRAWV